MDILGLENILKQISHEIYFAPELNAQILSVEVLLYCHVLRKRPRSSPSQHYHCAGLISYRCDENTQYLLAPFYKTGRKSRWGSAECECGDRFNQAPDAHQFYMVPPTTAEIDAWLRRTGFLKIDSTCESLVEKFIA